MNTIATADEFAQLHQGSTLVIQRWFPGTANRLWTYLVDARLRRQWLADGVMPSSIGTPFELIWRNNELSHPQDGRPEDTGGGEQRMTSHIVEATPPHCLVFVWGKGEVRFDLLEKDDRVRLTITHSGLDASNTGVFAGWHTHLDILSARIDGTPAPSFWPTMTRLRDLYQTRLGTTPRQPG